MAETKLDPVLQIDFGDNPGVVRFETLEDVERFVQAEENTWGPVFSTAQQLQQAGYGPFSPAIQPQMNALNAMTQQIQQQRQGALNARSTAISSVPFDTILTPFRNHTCVHSKSAIGRDVLENSKHTPGEAIAILLALPNAAPLKLQSDQGWMRLSPLLGGLISAKLLGLGINPQGNSQQTARLDEIAKEGQRAVAEQQGALSQFKDATAQALVAEQKQQEQFTKQTATLLDSFRQDIELANKLFSDQRTMHDDQLNKIRASFSEQMKLRAPREYWADKRSRHKSSARTWTIAFWGGCIVGLGAIYVFGANMVALAKGASEQAQAVEWVLIGVPAIIVLWILRFLHRQATANIALMSDADERVTMVETYLALQNEGKIEAVERPLVLQPLFRPSDAKGDDGVTKSLVDHAIDALGRK